MSKVISSPNVSSVVRTSFMPESTSNTFVSHGYRKVSAGTPPADNGLGALFEFTPTLGVNEAWDRSKSYAVVEFNTFSRTTAAAYDLLTGVLTDGYTLSPFPHSILHKATLAIDGVPVHDTLKPYEHAMVMSHINGDRVKAETGWGLTVFDSVDPAGASAGDVTADAGAAARIQALQRNQCVTIPLSDLFPTWSDPSMYSRGGKHEISLQIMNTNTFANYPTGVPYENYSFSIHLMLATRVLSDEAKAVFLSNVPRSVVDGVNELVFKQVDIPAGSTEFNMTVSAKNVQKVALYVESATNATVNANPSIAGYVVDQIGTAAACVIADLNITCGEMRFKTGNMLRGSRRAMSREMLHREAQDQNVLPYWKTTNYHHHPMMLIDVAKYAWDERQFSIYDGTTLTIDGLLSQASAGATRLRVGILYSKIHTVDIDGVVDKVA